jgi:hypothetical protein
MSNPQVNAGVALRNSPSYGDRYSGCRGPDHGEYVRGTLVKPNWIQVSFDGVLANFLIQPYKDRTQVNSPRDTSYLLYFDVLMF